MKSEKRGKLSSYVADKTEYYLVGSGAGDLKDSAWDILNVAGRLIMTRDATDDRVEHTITLRLYADDRFQICHDGDWAGQRGIGYMTGVRLCEDGVARVENEKGETVFWGHGPDNRPATAWDCRLCPGMDGVYTLTLVSDPTDPCRSTLSFRLEEPLSPLDASHEMIVVGDFNAWNIEDDDPRLVMTALGDDRVLLLGVDAPSECKVYDRTTATWYGANGGNLCLDAPGVYAVAYSHATEQVSVERCRLCVEADLSSPTRLTVSEWSEPYVTLGGRSLSLRRMPDAIPSGLSQEPLAAGKLRVCAVSRYGSRIWEVEV